MTTALALLVRLRSAVAVAPRRPRRRVAGRRAVLFFAGLMFALNFAFSTGMDWVFPGFRDPEYGRRLARLKERQRENPGRPTLVMLGSSRTAMGVRPAEANADVGPLVFNFAQVGSGPVMQVMTLRRLLYAGVRPDGVLLEYWPPFLREDGVFAEEARIDKHRLLPQDRGFVRDYFDQVELTEATMRHVRRNAIFEHRMRTLCQIVPGWLPFERRMDGPWIKLDAWGWLPGLETDPPAAERADRLWPFERYYRLLFADYRLDAKAERATRDLLATCRERNIPAAFVWLPEATEARGWYPPAALAAGERFLATVRAEYGVPLIDAREWVADPHLPDGIHLTQPGAAIFSKRLGDELRARNFGGKP